MTYQEGVHSSAGIPCPRLCDYDGEPDSQDPAFMELTFYWRESRNGQSNQINTNKWHEEDDRLSKKVTGVVREGLSKKVTFELRAG